MSKKDPNRRVTFRPDSRDASKDFQIPFAIANDLFNKGEIAMDGTNGGYMPLRNDENWHSVLQWKL